MAAAQLGGPSPPSAMNDLISHVSQLVQRITGVQLGERQRSMVEARLTRRMLDLGMNDAASYRSYVDKHVDSESKVLVSLLTTHHTAFFREFEQFEFLRDKGLAEIAKGLTKRSQRHLRVWSMACSRGQEAYTLAMFLSHHWAKIMPGGTFEILGTDVDTESISVARNGVYLGDEIKSVPSLYAANHWARGKGEISQYVRANDSLRKAVRFEAGNLLEVPKPTPGVVYDLIFCRNVFIYFTPAQISAITARILPHLSDEGYFCIGSTESLSGLGLPATYLGKSVYQRPKAGTPQTPSARETPVVTPKAVTPKRAIRVFCVDDSPTVHAVLKAVLSAEHGFEIVGKAQNGAEAAEMAKTLAFDVMTLDIHMPVKNGVDYLREHFRPGHPPVVVVSSISREETTLGVKTLELGALDYVEKPSLANLTERGDELRTKLRCAARLADESEAQEASKAAAHLATELKRQSRVVKTGETLRVIAIGVGDRGRLVQLLGALARPQPPTLIFVEGPEAMVGALAHNLASKCALPVKPITSEQLQSTPAPALADSVWLLHADAAGSALAALATKRRGVCLVYDSVSSRLIEILKRSTKGTVLLEEPLQNTHLDAGPRRALADRTVPYTSFLFDSDYLLNRE